MNDVATMISTLGFPIVACVGLGWFCKYMIDNNNRNIEKMFEMYDRSNEENRDAIKALNDSVSRLCDKLDDIRR